MTGKAIDVKTGMTYPDGQTPRLTTTALYEQYQEYCRLFNVPVPAEKGQVGRYLNEKFGISSAGTTEENVRIRYYPGLWLSKTARLAYAELSLNYSNYSKTTDKLQKKEGKNDIINLFTTATTEEWPKEVIEEIERMFGYIQSCQNPQDISYEGYVKNAVVSVVAVVGEQQIANPENSSVVLPSFSCSYEVEPVAKEETKTINAQLQAAGRANGQAERKPTTESMAEKYTKKTDPSHSSCLSCGDPIGPGHSTYFETFCGSCGPKLAMVRAAVKAHPDGFTLSGLWEDLAARGDRPPLKAYLPGMLQYLGYIEDGSVWRLPKSPAEPDPEQVGAEA